MCPHNEFDYLRIDGSYTMRRCKHCSEFDVRTASGWVPLADIVAAYNASLPPTAPLLDDDEAEQSDQAPAEAQT